MGVKLMLRQAASATVRAAVTPAVMVRDIANIAGGENLKTPRHVARVLEEVVTLPETLSLEETPDGQQQQH